MVNNMKSIIEKESHLTFIEFTSEKNRYGKRKASFKCRCGKIKEIDYYSVITNRILSCGCINKGNTSHGNYRTPEYNSWADMLQRCNNINNKNYKNYGARGIVVCDSWKVFENFLNDMGKKPDTSYTIERIKNNEGYNKENCKWATRKEQGNNRRNNKFITIEGRTQTLQQWADENKISEKVVRDRLKLKWNIKDAIFTPKLER